MTTRQYNFESGADGANLVIGDIGSGDPLNLANGSFRKYEAANAIHGSKSGRVTAAPSVAVNFGWDDVFGLGPLSWRVYIQFLADTSANGSSQVAVRNSSGVAASSTMDTSTEVRANVAGGGTLLGSPYTISLSTIYRIEGYVQPGTTTSNGIYKWYIYPGESLTALNFAYQTNVNTGTTPITRFRVGNTSGIGSCDYRIDSIFASDELSDIPGPLQASTDLTLFDGLGITDYNSSITRRFVQLFSSTMGLSESVLSTLVEPTGPGDPPFVGDPYYDAQRTSVLKQMGMCVEQGAPYSLPDLLRMQREMPSKYMRKLIAMYDDIDCP